MSNVNVPDMVSDFEEESVYFSSAGHFFPNQYMKRKFFSNVGSRLAPIYSAVYDEFGVLQLELIGEKDIYAEIQSFKDSVDINIILDRYMRGDSDVLNRVNGFYEDVSEFPRDYQEVLNAGLHAEQFFDTLPVDIKQKFNNSFSEFLVASGKDDFLSYFEKTSDSDLNQNVSETDNNFDSVVSGDDNYE